MNVAPLLRDVGKHRVMRPANELCIWGKTVINEEPPRDSEVAHLAIEHGNCRRRVLDERRQLRLSFCEVRFCLLAFADIDKHVDGTPQSSVFIEQRSRVGYERNPRAVLALSYRFHATDRSPLTQCQCHRALVMRQGCAIRPIELPGTAELVFAKCRAATPKLRRSLVVKGEAPLRVRHVDRGRKCLDSLPRETVDIAQRMDSCRAVRRNPC